MVHRVEDSKILNFDILILKLEVSLQNNDNFKYSLDKKKINQRNYHTQPHSVFL